LIGAEQAGRDASIADFGLTKEPPTFFPSTFLPANLCVSASLREMIFSRGSRISRLQYQRSSAVEKAKRQGADGRRLCDRLA
jgi:hypothetical protein